MELSTLSQSSISLPFITATQDGPKHIDTNLTRAKFEEMCSDLLDRRGPAPTSSGVHVVPSLQQAPVHMRLSRLSWLCLDLVLDAPLQV